VTTAGPRDLGGNVSAFYTPAGRPDPLWQAYTPTEEFNQVADDLANNNFATLEERRDLMAQALELSMLDSSRVWMVDRAGESPRRAETSVAADLYAAVYGSALWPYTLRRTDEVGGSLRVGMPSILTQPWNPMDSSNWVYDSFVFNGTGETAVNPDPYTGLALPNRVERAEVVVQEGLPVGVTLDWVTLEFVPEIAVPADAWANFDPATQEFIPVGDGVTALSKSTVYYEEDLYETTAWHDGSPFSVGDIVMFMITTFDRGQEASQYFDSSKTAALNQFLAAFKGVKITSTDPLVIETYTDAYALDAENNVTTWWPDYLLRSQGAWHTIALGLGAELAGEAAFSTAKAAELEVDQLNYIAGPTVAILATQLEAQTASGELPYAPTLSQFVTPEEHAERMANLAEWHRTRGHFWVGTGAFYLERAFPVEGTVILQRNPNYPDMADKWAGFSAAAIAEVEVDGPDRVTIGDEAVVDVFVTFEGEPYAQADINEVKYLVFDAENNLASTGVAEAVEDGHWQVTLDEETTGALAAGSNRLEIVTVSKRVALPTFSELLFVTAP
jgi:peptide/nickel transport system substrate-binding protein